MLDSYYEICGWEKESGIPTKKRLDELGLDFIRL
jgi:aldehyde:ferredoxin oxidoreductase